MKLQPQFVSLTEKGIALGTLLAHGKSWEEAEELVNLGLHGLEWRSAAGGA
jgi:hypothetical protein